VILRVEDRIQVEEDLAGWMGTAGESIMFREGETYGASICQRYFELLHSSDQVLLFQNIRDGCKGEGWGILDYRISDDRISLFLEVRYPVTNSKGEATSRFFQGMLCGILEVVLNVKLAVLESVFDKRAGALKIKYKVDWQKAPPRPNQ
jgi:hypothetical protein